MPRGKADRVLRPHRPHQGDALVHPPPALAKGRAEGGELGLHPADPGAEDQPTFGEVLQGRQFLGERQRVAHRQHQHAGAEPDPVGVGRRPGQGQHRIVKDRRRRIGRTLRHDDVLARPGVGKAQFLGLDCRPADCLRPRLAPDLWQMNPDSHPRSSSKHHCLRCDGGGSKLKRGGPEKETTAEGAAPLAAAACNHACRMRRRISDNLPTAGCHRRE